MHALFAALDALSWWHYGAVAGALLGVCWVCDGGLSRGH
jgi:hypothetical protein